MVDALQDGAGRRLRKLLADDDVDVRGLVAVAGRSTTLKTRMVAGRAAMSDEDWVALGALADDADYVARFNELFGLDLGPGMA